MAKTIKVICDRCEKEIHYPVVPERKIWLSGVGREGGLDLCDECYEELFKWFMQFHMDEADNETGYDKDLEDLVKGARKCYEDICNSTIHADNETGYDKGVDLNQRKKRIVSFEVVNKCSVNITHLKEMYGIGMSSRNISVTYWPNFDTYLMTALVSSNNVEHQMVRGDVDYETLSVELLRFFEYIDMAYGDDEKEE